MFGVLIGALVSYLAQIHATRMAIEAELRRLREEASIRKGEKRIDQIRDWSAEILALCDPDINAKVDYRQIVINIHRLQLILDTDGIPSHGRLNDAINKIGMLFQTKEATREALYPLQSQVVDAIKTMK